MRKTIVSSAFAATIGLAAASMCYAGGVLPADDDEELVPTGKGWGQRVPPGQEKQPPGNAKPQGSNGIVYHGGPVMGSGTVVEPIYWGTSWSADTQNKIGLLASFYGGVGGSSYFVAHGNEQLAQLLSRGDRA